MFPKLARILLCTFLFSSLSQAEVSTKQQSLVYKWLCAQDKDQRRKAHQFLSQLSESERPLQERLLKKARAYHAEAFEAKLENTYNSLRPFAEKHKDWVYQCNQALELGMKDLAYDSSDLKKLAQRQKKASRTYRELQKLSQTGIKTLKKLEPSGKRVLELDMEITMLGDDDEAAFEISLGDVYDDIPFGDHVRELQTEVQRFLSQQENFLRVDAYNSKAADWPTSPQRDFAKIINTMRVELGLSPLFLQKELCQGSINHSAEMAKLGYFAHESPTPANSSPSKRAKNADYAGSWQGENIYKGSSSPTAAYDAWWKSDGHRKIMLMNGPNHLGIGLVKAHWTLSMGKGKVPSET